MLFVILMPLLAIGVAMFRRSPYAVLDGPTEDAPLRLMRWTAGLLSEQRDEWGQAMLGELDHIEGRGRRWRFAIGCAGATLLLPPWGRAAAGMLAMIAVAIGSFGLYADMVIRYRLGIGDWVAATIALTFLTSLIVAAGVLLRRPRCCRFWTRGRSVRRARVAGNVGVHLLRVHRSDAYNRSAAVVDRGARGGRGSGHAVGR